jgi:hypothetical protein
MLILAMGLFGTWYYAFYVPTHFKRKVADEKGINISAVAVVKDYQSNEQVANLTYLNKILEVTGEITAIKQDQNGLTTVELKSDDAFSGVFCTLNSSNNQLKEGQQITIKGFCTGFLTDVVLSEAIVVK